MSDLIEITDEEREFLAQLVDLVATDAENLRSLANRKPVEPRATDPRIIMLSDEPRPFKADPAPSPDKVRGILRDEVVTVDGEPHIPVEVANRRLHEVERERDTLRGAVEACAEALGAWEMSSKPSDPTIAQGLLRAGDKARRALASLDGQGGSDER